MKNNNLYYEIYTDLYRRYGKYEKGRFLKTLFTSAGYSSSKFIVMYRIVHYFAYKDKNNFTKIFKRILFFKLKSMQVKYGITIQAKTNIGIGLSIPHVGTIVINEGAKIGNNCTILQGVTLGSNNFKGRYKAPVLGDNVYVGAGAKIVGPVIIGNNVTIGANAVVTKNIPDNTVVAGCPANIISKKPSLKINCDYLSKLDFFKEYKYFY